MSDRGVIPPPRRWRALWMCCRARVLIWATCSRSARRASPGDWDGICRRISARRRLIPPGRSTADSLRDGGWLSVYVFGGLDGRAVGHNITLDGSWFRSDPTVDPEAFVADVSYGFALLINPPIRFPQLELSFTHIERTHEFHGQSGNDVFGSVTVKMNWSFP